MPRPGCTLRDFSNWFVIRAVVSPSSRCRYPALRHAMLWTPGYSRACVKGSGLYVQFRLPPSLAPPRRTGFPVKPSGSALDVLFFAQAWRTAEKEKAKDISKYRVKTNLKTQSGIISREPIQTRIFSKFRECAPFLYTLTRFAGLSRNLRWPRGSQTVLCSSDALWRMRFERSIQSSMRFYGAALGHNGRRKSFVASLAPRLPFRSLSRPELI